MTDDKETNGKIDGMPISPRTLHDQSVLLSFDGRRLFDLVGFLSLSLFPILSCSCVGGQSSIVGKIKKEQNNIPDLLSNSYCFLIRSTNLTKCNVISGSPLRVPQFFIDW